MEEPGLPLAQWPQVLRGSALHTQIHFVQGKVEKTQQDALGEKYVWSGEEYSGRTECGYEAARGFLIAFLPNMFFSVGICDLKKKKHTENQTKDHHIHWNTCAL